ncbi:MAG: hypothetical protein HOW73_00865 [Polyangiaceae bacterium]|nr:hypothetical protein [Polyangiaceae bacterium]
MWIFLPQGFVSVVADRNDPTRLLVRARARADLEKLTQSLEIRPTISHTPHADYPYRLTIEREKLSALIAEHIAAMKYPNFKGAITDPSLLRCAHEVWDVMHDHEDDAARKADRYQTIVHVDPETEAPIAFENAQAIVGVPGAHKKSPPKGAQRCASVRSPSTQQAHTRQSKPGKRSLRKS